MGRQAEVMWPISKVCRKQQKRLKGWHITKRLNATPNLFIKQINLMNEIK